MMSLTSRSLSLSVLTPRPLRRAKKLYRLPSASLEDLRLAAAAEEPGECGSFAASAALQWGRKAGATSWATWRVGLDGDVHISPPQPIGIAKPAGLDAIADCECNLDVAPVIYSGADGRCLLLRATGSPSGGSPRGPVAQGSSQSTAQACVALKCSPTNSPESPADAGAIEAIVGDIHDTLTKWGVVPESVVHAKADCELIRVITPNVPLDRLAEHVELAHLAAHIECVTRSWQMSAAQGDGTCWVRVESVDDQGHPALVLDERETLATGIAAAVRMVDEFAVELGARGVTGHSLVTDRSSRFISISLGEAGQRLLSGDGVSEQERRAIAGRHGAPVRLVGASIEYMLSGAARGPGVAAWADQKLLESLEELRGQKPSLEAIYRVLTTSARVCFEGDPASTAWFIEGDRRDLPAHYPKAF